MKGVLIAGVIAAFAITVVDSLNCTQCHVFNSTCDDNVTECEEAGSLSCVESSVSSTLGGFLHLYQNKFCSESNCTENSTEVAFTVRIFDDQRFHFASQCCQGEACNGTHYESGTQESTNTQCMSCYDYNQTRCEEKPQQCYEGEQCVHIIAELTNGTGRVELKGCSDISNSTCQFLSAENTTVGEFVFMSVECTQSTEANSTTVTPSSIETSPTSVTTTTSMGIRASFTSSIFGSLLLLKLLF
ncbi:ly6/PLAUR domain-containing protein 8-like [Arvicanthis niloticus]|uniref:ly6/PLAUR domain-containing protein 8-like n=1 Tax=Arvicanthis niloticus TaxID=61156 RepID=UPI0014869ED8|nr:ly6/PLAUR domain-containing protein 8-like [Arvicanthis niloticus]